MRSLIRLSHAMPTYALALASLTPSLASASIADCPTMITPQPILTDQGALEAITFDAQGTLYLSNFGQDAIMTLTAKTTAPEILVAPLNQPGGLALGDSGELYVGSGNGPGGLFPAWNNAQIIRVDSRSGASETYASGLGMANGVVRAADGTLYASDDLASALDRILPDGTVEPGWLKLNSNGMALSQDGKTLYVNRSIPSRVMAVDLATETVSPHSAYSFAASFAFFDGLTIDANDTLYVAAYLLGAILKVDTQGNLCKLADDIPFASAAAFGVNPQGSADGFAVTSLFVTSHNGTLYELPGVL